MDAQAIRMTPACYQEARAIDLECAEQLPWPEDFFDVIVAADVLEHLRDPARVLRMLRGYIRSGGFAVISVPNVAHVSVRKSLLIGRFRYRERGILDRTHLHFYTFSTFRSLVESNGFEVDTVLAASDHFGVILNRSSLVGRVLRGLFGSAIVMVCRPER